MKKSRKIICEHCGVGYAPQGYAMHQKKVRAELRLETLGGGVTLPTDRNLTNQYESMMLSRQDFIDSALSVLKRILTNEEKKDFVIRLTSD